MKTKVFIYIYILKKNEKLLSSHHQWSQPSCCRTVVEPPSLPVATSRFRRSFRRFRSPPVASILLIFLSRRNTWLLLCKLDQVFLHFFTCFLDLGSLICDAFLGFWHLGTRTSVMRFVGLVKS